MTQARTDQSRATNRELTMVTSFRRITAMSAAGLALLAACSSEPTSAPSSPLAPDAASSSLSGLQRIAGASGLSVALTNLPGLQRKVALPASITVQQTFGTSGGVLSIPQAGVTLSIPGGALAAPLTISMTARAGSLIAYDFEPHGTVFAQPLVFVQSLGGTNATPLSAALLQLGYYSDPANLSSQGALVDELRGGTLNSFRTSFTSSIPHFSGYMVAVGRR